ncbi:MAG: FecR domain-containing protein, partial [Polaromonas sp.]
SSALQAQPASVARVALSVGDATRVNAAGQAEQLRLGSTLNDGDRVVTGKDAVVILVFVDQGRVSLRADTELIIHKYRVDPAGIDNQISLELVRGAMRQISGQAAHLQPERYRLNTPIAAIGVRGTDFLAKAQGDTLETFVQEGKIVILPGGIASGCAVAGTSSPMCDPLAAISADDASRYLRLLATGKMERRVISNDEMEQLFGISVAKATPSGETVRVAAAGAKGASDTAKPASLIDEFPKSPVARSEDQLDEVKNHVTGQGVSDAGVSLAPTSPAAPAVPVAPVVVAGPADAAAPVTPAVPVTVVTAPITVPVTVPAPVSTQLVWGRFSNAAQLPMQLLLPYDEASKGRHVTVGEPGQYALWRVNPSGRLDASLRGQTEFIMTSGEAVFQSKTDVSAAQIQKATLSVDFDRARFATSMTLISAQTGAVGLSASGKINDEGIFTGVSADQRVAGALTRDGKEAGMLFSLNHELGVFQGVSLWNSR